MASIVRHLIGLLDRKKSYALLDKSLLTVSALISVFIVIRIMPEYEFGLFTLVSTFDMVVFTISGGLVLQALQKYAAEGDREATGVLVTNAALLYMAMSMVPAFLITLFPGVVARIFRADGISPLLRWLPLLVASQWGQQLAFYLLLAVERIRDVFIVDATAFFVRTVLILIAFSMGRLDKAMTVMSIQIVSHIAASVAGAFLVYAQVKPVLRISRHWMKKVLVFGKYSMGTTIGNLLHTRTDALFLSFFYGPAVLALYTAARRIADFFRHFVQAANMVVLPRASHFSARNDHSGVRTIYFKGLIYSAALIIPIMLPLLLFPGFFLHLAYGAKYLKSTAVLQLFAVCAMISPLGTIGSSVASGIGKPGDTFMAIWLSVLINVVLNLIFIPHWGPVGAAWAALAAMTVGGVWITFLVHRNIRLPFSKEKGSFLDVLVHLVRPER